jgi:signal transduction histidine kinase
MDVRRLVGGLHPPALDELGLAGACAQAADRLTAGTELTASMLAPDDLPALPAAVEVAAYRIVVEAVTKNRPARPRAALPGVHQPRDTALTISVTDDGAGLHTTGSHGYGLVIMGERAEELGGGVMVTDRSPGVMVQARLPTETASAHVPTVQATGAVPG